MVVVVVVVVNLQMVLTKTVQTNFDYSASVFLQCFDAVGWVAGRASSLQKN